MFTKGQQMLNMTTGYTRYDSPICEALFLELFRADWMLRGAVIPAGEGELIMRFEPDSYQLGENISRASSIALILLLIGSIAGMLFTSRRKN